MKKLLLVALVPLVMGAAGFGAGWFLMPRPAPVSATAGADNAPKEVLFKMPLGKFTIQVLQPGRILHIVIDMDVYIAGAADFERLNGANGRARLRDATIAAASDLAETTLWTDKGTEDALDKNVLAEQIVRKLHSSFNTVRSGRINELWVTENARN